MNHQISRGLLRTFRCVAAAAVAFAIAPPVTFSLAAATNGPGSNGSNSLLIKLESTQTSPARVAVVGGDAVMGTLELSQPAPKGGVKVTVTSDNKNAKIAPLLPQSITIPAGSTVAGFEVITSPVKQAQGATIFAATKNGLVGKGLLALEPNGVAFVVMKPARVKAGGSATGEVKLKHPAPKDVLYYKNTANFGQPKKYVKTLRKGGATVTLMSTRGVTAPANINVLQGASSSTFTASASPSAASASQSSSCVMGPGTQTAVITATWEHSASGTLQVLPNGTTKSRYTSGTIRIDPGTIVGISHDALVLVLEHSQCTDMLKAGSIMFVKRVGVLDVKKVATFPSSSNFVSLLSHDQLVALKRNKSTGVPQGGIAVGVDSAALTDFINDGTLQVLFQNLGAASEPGGGGSNDPFAAAAEPNSEQPSGKTPWKYSTTGTPTGYMFTAFKENNGLSGSVSAKGKITNGGYNFLAVIHDDKLQEAKFTADMEGSVDVDWAAQDTSGNDIGDPRLRMRPLFSGIVDEDPDGIPFLFQIDANLIFRPGFGEKAAAKGHFKVTFSGEGGIDGSSGVDTSLGATPDISSTTSSAKAPHGVVVAVNVPKFALSFSTTSFLWAAWNRLPVTMGTKAADFADSFETQLDAHLSKDVTYPDPADYFKVKRGAYVQWTYSLAYAGAGLLAMLPCQQYYQNYLVQAGIDQKMLGSISGAIPPGKGVQAFTTKKLKVIPDMQGCYPKK